VGNKSDPEEELDMNGMDPWGEPANPVGKRENRS